MSKNQPAEKPDTATKVAVVNSPKRAPEQEKMEKSPYYLVSEVEPYLEKYNDTMTLVAETLEGQMRSCFEFTFDGWDLIAEDGRNLSGVFENALVEADALIADDPRLAFEKPRRQAEMEEYRLMVDMARGKLPNTMIVVTEVPTELLKLNESLIGYDTKRKKAMFRVISLLPNGQIRIVSQSLDQNDYDGLAAIYGALNQKVDINKSLLSQRTHKQLDLTSQERLVDGLRYVYDQTLSQKYGGNWYAGRNDTDQRNTFDFVLSQHDLIDYFAKTHIHSTPTSGELYNLAAVMKSRFDGMVSHGVSIEKEITSAGTNSRNNGDNFMACGVSLVADKSISNIFGLLGYGNTIKKMNCPFCKAVKYGDPCSSHQKCGSCKAEVRDGKVISYGNAKNKKKLGKKSVGFVEWLFGYNA